MARQLSAQNVSFWIAKQTADLTSMEFAEVKRAGGDYDETLTSTDSALISSDRLSADSVITDSSVSGELSTEVLLAESVDMLRIGALQSATSTPFELLGATLNVTQSTNLVDGGDFTGVNANDFVRIDNTDDSTTLILKAASAGTGTNLAIVPGYITTDNEFSAKTCNAKTNRYTSGKTQQKFVIQKRIDGRNPADTADQVYYTNNDGAEVFLWSFSAATGAILTESFSITGLSQAVNSTTYPSQSDKSVDEGSVLGSVQGIEAIFIDDVYVPCFVTQFDFSLDNVGTENKAIGQRGACSLSYNNPTITGALNTYIFADAPFATKQKFVDQSKFKLSVVMKSPEGRYMILTGEEVKYTALTESPETGALVSNGSLKFVGRVSLDILH